MPRSGTRPPGRPGDLRGEVTREVPDDAAQERCAGPGDGRLCISGDANPFFSARPSLSSLPVAKGARVAVWILRCFLHPSSSQFFPLQPLASTFATWPLLYLKDSCPWVSSNLYRGTRLWRPDNSLSAYARNLFLVGNPLGGCTYRVHTEN